MIRLAEGVSDLGEAVPFVDLTPVGLLGLVFLLVLFGKLVPRGRLEELRKDKDAVIAEKNATIRAIRAQFGEVLQQNTILIYGVAQPAKDLLSALPELEGEGEDDSVPTSKA